MINYLLSFAGLTFSFLLPFYFTSLTLDGKLVGTEEKSLGDKLLSSNELKLIRNEGSQNGSTDEVKQRSAIKSEVVERWPGIQITVKTGPDVSTTLILYHNEMKIGLDPGYDIGLVSAKPEFQLYTRFSNHTGVKYMQQALPIEGCDTIVVPIGFECDAGGEVIFSAITEPLENYSFIFEDRTAGVFIDIANTQYTVTLPVGTEGIGRFFLHTKRNNTTDINNNQDDERRNKLTIWATGNRIIIDGNVSEKAHAEVYDIQGRLILKLKLEEGPFHTLFIPGIKSGVYIVKIVDSNTSKTTRVIFN